MITQNDLDEYEEATLVRKAAEACIMAVVKSDDDNVSIGSQSTENSRTIEELAPGQVQYLNTGEDITFNNPPASTGYAEYINTRLHAIAAGIGVTYEQMTGDLSQVNYSSIRAGTLDFRREIQQFQWLTFIPMVCERVMNKWLSLAALSNRVKTDLQVEWTTPKWDWVDPVKDVQGELLELQSGLKSYHEALRGRGLVPDNHIEEVIKGKQILEQLGLSFSHKAEKGQPPE
jgi:lambda family phage portal protein